MLSDVSAQSYRFRLCVRVQHAVVPISPDHRVGQSIRELKVSTVLFYLAARLLKIPVHTYICMY